MAKKVTNQNKKPEKKHFVTPTETWWGKAIVWALFIGMVGFVVIGLIAVLIDGNA